MNWHRISLLVCLSVFIVAPWASLPLALVLVIVNIIRNNRKSSSGSTDRTKPSKRSGPSKTGNPSIIPQTAPEFVHPFTQPNIMREESDGGYFDTVEDIEAEEGGYFGYINEEMIGMFPKEVLESEQTRQNMISPVMPTMTPLVATPLPMPAQPTPQVQMVQTMPFYMTPQQIMQMQMMASQGIPFIDAPVGTVPDQNSGVPLVL